MMTDQDIVERAAEILGKRLHEGFCMSDQNDLVLHAAIRLRDESREVLLGYWLDSRQRLIGVEELAAGSAQTVSFSSREICRRAIAVGAEVAVLVHNHPDGTLEPSDADKAAAQLISQRLAVIGVLGLHHVVTRAGATNILTGDSCTFTSTPAAVPALLCPSCGLQALPAKTPESTS